MTLSYNQLQVFLKQFQQMGILESSYKLNQKKEVLEETYYTLFNAQKKISKYVNKEIMQILNAKAEVAPLTRTEELLFEFLTLTESYPKVFTYGSLQRQLASLGYDFKDTDEMTYYYAEMFNYFTKK